MRARLLGAMALGALCACSQPPGPGSSDEKKGHGSAASKDLPEIDLEAEAAKMEFTPPPLPEASHEAITIGNGKSLLSAYVDRDPVDTANVDAWVWSATAPAKRPRLPVTYLPAHAKRIVVGALIMAAHDRIDGLEALFAPNASWGLPDRREIGAVDIFADGGERFIAALRKIGSRLHPSAAFSCPPLTPGADVAVRNGAEPMWCHYRSNDGVDLLVFKLAVVGGSGRIEYVGFFENRPRGPVRIDPGLYGEPPPMAPRPKLPGDGSVDPDSSRLRERVPSGPVSEPAAEPGSVARG